MGLTPKTSRSRIALAALLVVAYGTAGPVLAHHGWGGYDSANPVTATGTVRVSGWQNPHGFVDLDAHNRIWHVVLAPPSRMNTRGLSKDTLKPGVIVTVFGYPSKTVKNEMRAERITVAGKTTELR